LSNRLEHEETAIELRHVSAGYGGPPVLHDLSLTIRQGEFLGVLGSNGSGKSTLLRAMCGLLPLEQGSVHLAGRPLEAFSRRQLACRVAFLPQHSVTDVDLIVREMVALGRAPHLGRLGRFRKQDREKVEQTLEAVDLKGLAERSMLALSGGEKQRVMLARALAQEPGLLLLDEPTTYLDLAHQVEFFELLSQLHATGKITIVFVSHDVNLCANYVERVALLKEGTLHEIGPPEEMIRQEVLQAVYQTAVRVGRHPQTGRPQVFLERKEPR